MIYETVRQASILYTYFVMFISFYVLFTALKPYNEPKANISSMLENHHCIQLATYFDLTPAEAERVTIDVSPGRMLMKILDEREKIMPWKMFGLLNSSQITRLGGYEIYILGNKRVLWTVFFTKKSADFDVDRALLPFCPLATSSFYWQSWS